MAAPTPHQDELIDQEDAEQFIEYDEILGEVPEDGDAPMDEDDDQEVFTIATHSTLPIAVSGGEDDLGYLWNVDDGEEIVKLTGHSDSVTAARFNNYTGGDAAEMVATGGMDGKVRVWRRVKKDESGKTWEFLTELQGPDEVMWLRWHPKGNVLLAGSNDSTVWLWQLPSGNTMQVFAGHTGPVNCGLFTPDGKKILTACQDGTLILWDPRQSTPVWKLSPADGRFNFENGITSLAINPASTLAVVGGADGAVRVVNITRGEITGALEGHKEEESVEDIAFLEWQVPGSGAGGLAVTGGTDGRVCVWDLSTMRLRETLEHADAVTTLLPHPAPNAHLLTTASADKTLRTWDARNGKLLREHKGHQGPVLAAALVASTGGAKVVSAGDDGVCLVFSTEE
ncbi:WD40 repeat-like protein [Sistotremastrum suecicum HHB10207 ss-3]|uniref:WD40 repeat-like protein n=1 Tax=Sistotremastrum suecicum HHB10207 ss-3 TaxID=1314776 RepID=A0A166FBC6_9AGAM|nr:WD40 repeat-like protein [Sistotremastrum suecicum HHB10207 ss-3]